MKRLLCSLILIFLFGLQSCTVKRYYYVMEQPADLYFSQFSKNVVRNIQSGDTVATSKKVALLASTPLEYKGYLFYAPNPQALFSYSKKIKRSQAKTKSSFLLTLADEAAARKANSSSTTSPRSSGYRSTPSTGATIHTGPRGGKYYINSNGNKTYIKKK